MYHESYLIFTNQVKLYNFNTLTAMRQLIIRDFIQLISLGVKSVQLRIRYDTIIKEDRPI